MSRILCCLCGTSIIPNEAAMCIECIRSQFDITDVIGKSCEIVQCRKCDRWNTARDHWMHHEMESSGLLTCCLKMVPGIHQVKIIEAKWIWTEPHSKRLKIQITLERGVLDDKITLRQNCVVEFVIKNKQCLPCIREATDHTWGALVQLRQKVGHKRAMYTLEAELIKSGLHSSMINIAPSREGLDFYFKGRNNAEKVVEFISNRIPTKSKASQKLVSKDTQSNTARTEFTIYLEIAPLCKGDLVITDKALTGGLELMLVTKLTNAIHLLNPVTMHKIIVPSMKYFLKPFSALLSLNHLTPFIVIDIAPLTNPAGASSGTVTSRNKGKDIEPWMLLAEVEVCRESDLGENDTTFRVLTHLGRLLQAGDTVLGYDLQHTMVDGELLSSLPYDCPDVVLVRKSYEDIPKPKRHRSRGKAKGVQAPSVAANDAGAADAEPANSEDIDAEVEGVGTLSGDINEELLREFQRQLDDEEAMHEELSGQGFVEVDAAPTSVFLLPENLTSTGELTELEAESHEEPVDSDL